MGKAHKPRNTGHGRSACVIPAAPPSPDASQEVLLRVEEPAIQCSSGNITDIDSSKAPMTLGNNDGACVYVCVCGGGGQGGGDTSDRGNEGWKVLSNISRHSLGERLNTCATVPPTGRQKKERSLIFDPLSSYNGAERCLLLHLRSLTK